VAPAKDFRGFVFHNRFWGGKKLSASTLSDADGEYLMMRCFGAWAPPKSPEIPDRFEVSELNGFFMPSRTIQFAESGITIRRRKQVQRYGWSELSPVVIDRYRGQTVGFTRCEIPIPKKTCLLKASDRESGWRGPDPIEIAKCIETYAPADRIVHVCSGTPESLTEVLTLIERVTERYIDARRSRLPLVAIFALGPLGLLCFSVWVCGQPVDTMGVVGAALLGGLGVFTAFALPRHYKTELESLERRKQELLGSSGGGE
jgi:hypothetical protein